MKRPCKNFASALRLVGVAAGLSLTAACSTIEPPTSEMAQARASVGEAQQTGAREYAAVALESAMSNLRKAEQALNDGDNLKAQDLAVRARLDAELAEAKMRSGQAQKAEKEVRASIESMRQEVERARRTVPAPVVMPSSGGAQ